MHEGEEAQWVDQGLGPAPPELHTHHAAVTGLPGASRAPSVKQA